MIHCINCKKEFTEKDNIGTKNRNHCPYCLHSLHLDEKKPGDRLSKCKGVMQPVALTFKKAKHTKYGKQKKGEIMLVHRCTKCGKISKNRIAGDDDPQKVLEILHNKEVNKSDLGMEILTTKDREEVRRQLLGE